MQYYDHLPADRPGLVAFGGQTYPWHVWGNIVEPKTGTETWGTYQDQFYKGSSAILHKPHGTGSCTYVGTWTVDWDMEYQLLRTLYERYYGKLPFDLPPYIFVDYREGLWVGVNYTDQSYTLPAPTVAQFLIGGPELSPGGVTVWKD